MGYDLIKDVRNNKIDNSFDKKQVNEVERVICVRFKCHLSKKSC